MKWYFIVLIIIGIFLITATIIYILSLLVIKKIACPKRCTGAEQTAYYKKMGYKLGTESLEMIPIAFKMSDGYIINGNYDIVKGSKKFCILVHGHSSSRISASRYAIIFKAFGFSTIIYDQRGHGDNIRESVSMGVFESQDLSEIINQVYQKFGSDITLGLQGVSMGAATVLLVCKYQPSIKFVVADCGYARFKDVVEDSLYNLHLSRKLFIPLVNFNLKLYYHWGFNDCEPIEAIKDSLIPILFIHGKNDTFIKPINSEELYEAKAGYKEIMIVRDAGHAASLYTDEEGYVQKIKSFLNNIGVK